MPKLFLSSDLLYVFVLKAKVQNFQSFIANHVQFPQVMPSYLVSDFIPPRHKNTYVLYFFVNYRSLSIPWSQISILSFIFYFTQGAFYLYNVHVSFAFCFIFYVPDLYGPPILCSICMIDQSSYILIQWSFCCLQICQVKIQGIKYTPTGQV